MMLNRNVLAAAALMFALAMPELAMAHGASAKPADFSAFCSGGTLELAAESVERELQGHPDNAELRQFALELQKNMRRTTLFEQEQNPELAVKIGKNLRQFFYRNGLLAEAEKVDRKIFALKPELANAVKLAETLLNQKQNRQVADLLIAQKTTPADRDAHLLTALALARLEQLAESQEYLARTPFESCKPQELMIYARVAALHGDEAAAAAAVTRILERAPAKENSALQAYFHDEDFRKVVAGELFGNALKTPSQSGDSCAGCPNRGTSRCDGGDCD